VKDKIVNKKIKHKIVQLSNSQLKWNLCLETPYMIIDIYHHTTISESIGHYLASWILGLHQETTNIIASPSTDGSLERTKRRGRK